jgi:5-methylcytosine-specific restriction endonuclease McrA
MNTNITTTENLQVKPCIKCGAQERDKRGACMPCKRERNQKYRAANREKVSDYNRAYREANREQLRAYISNWSQINRQKLSEYRRDYDVENRDKRKMAWHNRKARIKGNGGALSKDIVERLMIEQDGKCVCCGADLKGTGHHLDHIMPLALGGSNTDDNVQLLTPSCNLKKGARHPDEWIATLN